MYPDGLPVGVGVDIVVAFFLTNNSLRHQYFLDENLEEGPLLESRTYHERFLEFLIELYGSWNGQAAPLTGDSELCF